MTKSRIHCVVGGMFGSEAKGATAGFLSTQIKGPVVGVRVGGPNAGHTYYGRCPSSCDPDGGDDHSFGEAEHPWRLRQVPVLAVSRPDAQLIIAQGSEVDPAVLRDEVVALDSAGYGVSNRLFVDWGATIITEEHKLREAQGKLTDRLGSTAKGIGAARSDRIMRTAMTVDEWTEEQSDQFDGPPIPGRFVADTTYSLNRALAGGVDIVIEGTQGYGLGLHTKYYPFATSGDCRAIDLLAQCGLSPWGPNAPEVHVWLVIRPNPIRVAGNSGPLLDETTWDALGLPEEQTTVTKKTRRVGGWDPGLVNEAIRANGGAGPNLHVVLTMLDHLVPGIANKTEVRSFGPNVVQDARTAVFNLEQNLSSKIELVGTGPKTMMWWRGSAPNAVTVDPLADVRQSVENVIRTFQNVYGGEFTYGEVVPNDPWPTEAVPAKDELTEWWLSTAYAEVEPMAAKALEYGGKGAAVDLIDIGTDLVRMAGRKPDEFDEAQLAELGVVFYVRGKVARITAAVVEGRFPSDDTWHDLGVYARMAQRIRAVGGWPYKSMDEGV